MACGTGRHVELLRKRYEVEGLDISGEMLEAARARCPGVVFHQADMRTFALGRRFDVVTCLFGSIGYVGRSKSSPRRFETYVTTPSPVA